MYMKTIAGVDLVSVIIPVYNTEMYIERCIKSVINQTYTNLEVIIIDDGSKDNSLRICRNLENNDSRIKVIAKENEGAGYARNTGMDLANGKFLLFLDSDDYLLPHCIERCVEVAQKENGDIVKFKWAKGRRDNYSETYRKKKYHILDNKEAFESRKTDICVWGKLFKRETIGEIRYPKVSTFDDEFITYKLIYQAKKIILLDEVYYYYFMSPNSIMRRKRDRLPLTYMCAYQERKEFFLKNKEIRLYEISAKEYAIRLMLSYLNYDNFEMAEKSSEDILKMFYEEYQIGVHTAKGAKEILSLFLFARMPKLCKRIKTMREKI